MFVMGGVLTLFITGIFFVFFAGALLHFGWITYFLKGEKNWIMTIFGRVKNKVK
jgi:ATP-binding cassette subfamily B protein